MKTSLGLALGSLVTFSAGSAAAHPGHGGADGNGALHYLVDHPLLALGLAAAVVGSTLLASKLLPRRG
jgi:hypothetical protein